MLDGGGMAPAVGKVERSEDMQTVKIAPSSPDPFREARIAAQ